VTADREPGAGTWIEFERAHAWHPYTSIPASPAPLPVRAARGVHIELEDGRKLIDGMSSWWSAIHGYNHPHLNQALLEQANMMSHVMFGGLTHEPAGRLVEKLVDLTPTGLDRVFLCDSGSVAVEVALKMAFQYWHGRSQPQRNRFFTLRRGYHGDTIGAMSVSDPDNGMHHLFAGLLAQQIFLPAPPADTDEFDNGQLDETRRLFEQHAGECAALILEPVVQGAGGMRFYRPEYLAALHALCREFDVLLIADEIATGFGRAGHLFACEKANISPDILCVGKALTGGVMTMAATLCSTHVANHVCAAEPGVFMHGPTFMGNPLAAAVACASLELLERGDWRQQIQSIECLLRTKLEPARSLEGVRDVRVLGGIGVIQMESAVDMARAIEHMCRRGVWLRPFGPLIYTMPPYIIQPDELEKVADTMVELAAL